MFWALSVVSFVVEALGGSVTKFTCWHGVERFFVDVIFGNILEKATVCMMWLILHD